MKYFVLAATLLSLGSSAFAEEEICGFITAIDHRMQITMDNGTVLPRLASSRQDVLAALTTAMGLQLHTCIGYFAGDFSFMKSISYPSAKAKQPR